MAGYDSTNTVVLETHVQDDNPRNTRMMLFYDCGTRHEYIIGSYFKETELPDGVKVYSWDWGHYFNDPLPAAAFWQDDVLDHIQAGGFKVYSATGSYTKSQTDIVLDQLAALLGCEDICEKHCVFPMVGESEFYHCPLNEIAELIG